MNYYRCLTIVGVIAICAVVFAVERASHETFGDDWGVSPAKVGTAATHLRSGSLGAQHARAFATLVTHMFLHGDVDHILYNMVFLWVFGVLCCQLIGQWQTFVAYFVCGIGGAIVHILLNRGSSVPAIGASGAISGLEGLYVGLAMKWQTPPSEVWPLAYAIPRTQWLALAAIGFVFNLLLMGRHDQHIAYGAHLGGLLTGIAIAAVMTTIYPTMSRYKAAKGLR